MLNVVTVPDLGGSSVIHNFIPFSVFDACTERQAMTLEHRVESTKRLML